GCSKLTSITIGNGVTSIGWGAFSGVQSVQVSAGHPVFFMDEQGILINKKEKKLLYVPRSFSGSYTIPDSVTSIGDYAFLCCSNLTSVTIPESVTSIGDNAFYGCEKLTSITIPESVTSIGERAFSFCRSLTSVVIPDSVTSIGYAAFSDCSSLKRLTIPAKCTDKGASILVPSSCEVIRK
ncbi:MAG: leucine-rich repeat domain-containing protein, partial [Lentisphaeria bacterium]|nr:leucine-rich repeat domain-containing protein [Lentisphaeria bacterium]